jgi:hypothetical protein
VKNTCDGGDGERKRSAHTNKGMRRRREERKRKRTNRE